MICKRHHYTFNAGHAVLFFNAGHAVFFFNAGHAGCSFHRIDMSKEVSRAAWNSTYEKGLVDILHDHNNNPKFKGQNGWVSEGWRSITIKFNERFPIAHFTKQQLQEKEKELKASYKLLRDAKKQSGTGWDDSMGMIIAEPKIWDKIIKVRHLLSLEIVIL